MDLDGVLKCLDASRPLIGLHIGRFDAGHHIALRDSLRELNPASKVFALDPGQHVLAILDEHDRYFASHETDEIGVALERFDDIGARFDVAIVTDAEIGWAKTRMRPGGVLLAS